MERIIDLLDVAAKNYPIKALCDEINKAESTLRNELTSQPGYKLGLVTAILILKKTGDLRALDEIENSLGRVAFSLPAASAEEMHPLIEMVGEQAKEFGEHMSAVAGAMADGRIEAGEAQTCLKELKDVLEATIRLQAYLEQFLDKGRLKDHHKPQPQKGNP